MSRIMIVHAHKHLHPCYYHHHHHHHHFLTFSFYPDTIAQEIGAQIDDTKHQIAPSQRIGHGAERRKQGSTGLCVWKWGENRKLWNGKTWVISHVPIFHITQPLDSMRYMVFFMATIRWCPIDPSHGTFNNPWKMRKTCGFRGTHRYIPFFFGQTHLGSTQQENGDFSSLSKEHHGCCLRFWSEHPIL